MEKELTDEVYDSVYSAVPRLTVDLVIRTARGFVLARRDIPPWKGYWHLPGGRVRMGETIRETIERVAKYETNLDVKQGRLLGVIEYLRIRDKRHDVALVYLASRRGGRLRGSDLGRSVGIFLVPPGRTIAAQKAFLKRLGRPFDP